MVVRSDHFSYAFNFVLYKIIMNGQLAKISMKAMPVAKLLHINDK